MHTYCQLLKRYLLMQDCMQRLVADAALIHIWMLRIELRPITDAEAGWKPWLLKCLQTL